MTSSCSSINSLQERQPYFINDLPDEVLTKIFQYAIGGGSQDGWGVSSCPAMPPTAPQTIVNLAKTCRRWRAVLGDQILKDYWTWLQQAQRWEGSNAAPPFLQPFQTLRVSIARVEKVNNVSIKVLQENPFFYYVLFHALSEEMKEQGARVSSKDPEQPAFLGFLPVTYVNTQLNADAALKRLWTELGNPETQRAGLSERWGELSLADQIMLAQQHLEFQMRPDQEVLDIREWFRDPSHCGKPSSVTHLALHCFRNALEEGVLNLPGGARGGATREICHFTNLVQLNLSHNDLAALPEDIGNLTQLTSLDLSENRLTTLPQSLANLVRLEEFLLSRNRLTSLDPAIIALPHVEEFDLQDNCLRTIPSPVETWKEKSLYLYGNPIVHLPEEIADFEAGSLCIVIPVDSSLIAFLLYKQFGNPCSELFHLRNSHFAWHNSRLLLSYLIQAQRPCSTYACQTKLAFLCQNIHLGAHSKDLFSIAGQLPRRLQRLISQEYKKFKEAQIQEEKYFLEQGRGFDVSFEKKEQRELWIRGIVVAIRRVFSYFSPEQQEAVYTTVWELSGKPDLSGESKTNWGQKHAMDNPILFIDAMALVGEKHRLL